MSIVFIEFVQVNNEERARIETIPITDMVNWEEEEDMGSIESSPLAHFATYDTSMGST